MQATNAAGKCTHRQAIMHSGCSPESRSQKIPDRKVIFGACKLAKRLSVLFHYSTAIGRLLTCGGRVTGSIPTGHFFRRCMRDRARFVLVGHVGTDAHPVAGLSEEETLSTEAEEPSYDCSSIDKALCST
jgi:hypothetical protein